MDEWGKVEKCLERAQAVAFDECHKIYIATDKHEANHFIEYGWETFIGTPSEMVDKVFEWYEASCNLRFVQAVRFDKKKGERVFRTLIPQTF